MSDLIDRLHVLLKFGEHNEPKIEVPTEVIVEAMNLIEQQAAEIAALQSGSV